MLGKTGESLTGLNKKYYGLIGRSLDMDTASLMVQPLIVIQPL